MKKSSRVSKPTDPLVMRDFSDDMQLLKNFAGSPNNIPHPATARQIVSPILRKWICDGSFREIERVLGQKLDFPQPKIQNHSLIGEFALALCPIMFANSIFVYSVAKHKDLPSPLWSDELVSLKKFCEGKIAFNSSQGINRKALIRHTSNKLGGTHGRETAHRQESKAAEYWNAFGVVFCGVIDREAVLRIQSMTDFTELVKDSEWPFAFSHLVCLDTWWRFEHGLRRANLNTQFAVPPGADLSAISRSRIELPKINGEFTHIEISPL